MVCLFFKKSASLGSVLFLLIKQFLFLQVIQSAIWKEFVWFVGGFCVCCSGAVPLFDSFTLAKLADKKGILHANTPRKKSFYSMLKTVF